MDKTGPHAYRGEKITHSMTVWNHDFFNRVQASTLPDALLDLLNGLNEKIPSSQTALYSLDKGHLSLLMSNGTGGNHECVQRVSYLKLQEQFRQDVVFDDEEALRLFFRVPPPLHMVVFPLRLNNEVKGAAVLLRPESTVPSAHVRGSLSSCLASMATLISSVESLGREHRRSSYLSVVNKIIQGLDVLLDEKQLYGQIVNMIQRSFKYDHVAIYTLDRDANVLNLKAMAGKFGKVIPRDQTIPLGQGIVSWVVGHDKTLVSNNVHKNPFFLNWTPALITTEAELCVPIHVDNQVIGVLNIEHSESLYFDKDDTNSIELLADRIGVAIKNSRLYSELSSSHAQLQEIVSSMGQGLIIVGRDSRIKWVNEAVKKLGLADNGGGSLVDLFGANSVKVERDLIQPTLIDRGMRRELIKGREDRYFIVVTAPVLDGAKLRTEVLIVIDDVTAGMQTQAELVRTKQELEMSQRQNILGELGAFIAHEIRNPLNAMTQAADLLETGDSVAATQRKWVKVLKEESKSLNDILSSYLKRAGPPEPHFVLWDIRTIIEQVISSLTADQSLVERINIKLDVEEPIAPVSLDVSSIKQLFLNLLLNAIEAIKGRGEVQIKIKRDDESILVQVHDNGCGIPQSSLPHIFKPFVTTKDTGTGLGLAVVKRIVEEHGWEIRAESKESEGTQFTLVIPTLMERM